MARLVPMTRRRFLGQLIAAGGGLALAACGASPRDQAANPSAAPSSAPAASAASTAGAASSPAVSSSQGGSTSFMNWDDIKGTPIEMVLQAYEKQTGKKVENG